MPDPLLSVPFKRAVLGLNGGRTDPLVVKLGCEFARSFKASLVALHVIEVDWTHDLSDDISDGTQVASAVLDMAEAIAEKYQIELQTELLQARDVGAALVDEAAELDADLMILGLPYRRKFGGDFAIGLTIPYVFQNAACRVIVVREAIGADDPRAGHPLAAMPATVEIDRVGHAPVPAGAIGGSGGAADETAAAGASRRVRIPALGRGRSNGAAGEDGGGAKDGDDGEVKGRAERLRGVFTGTRGRT